MAVRCYMSSNILLMLIAGTCKYKTESKIKKNLFQFWRLAFSINVFYVFIAVFIDLIQKGMGNLELVVLNYVYLGISITIWFHLNYYYVFDDKTETLLSEINALLKYRTQTLLKEKDLSSSINLARKITYTWISFATFIALGFVILFLIFNPRKLPLPMWIPYDWRSSPIYEVTLLYQTFMQEMLTLVVVGTDTFFASVILLTCRQFRLLGWEIQNLIYTVMIKNGANKDIVLAFQDFVGGKTDRLLQKDGLELQSVLLDEILMQKKVRADLMEGFNHLVQFHQSLLSFCEHMEVFFSPMHLPYFLLTLSIDMLIATIITTTKDLVLMVTISLYMLCATVNLFFPCYFGYLLTSQVEDFHYYVYDSAWYLCDKAFKSHLKILHLTASKPIVLSVGKFADLSLSLFLWILTAFVFYVTILYKLTRKDS